MLPDSRHVDGAGESGITPLIYAARGEEFQLQRDPEPPRRNLLWRVLAVLVVVLSAVAWAPLP